MSNKKSIVTTIAATALGIVSAVAIGGITLATIAPKRNKKKKNRKNNSTSYNSNSNNSNNDINNDEYESEMLDQSPKLKYKHHGIVEICLSDINAVHVAVLGGANSVELCSDIAEGGITPRYVIYW